jgi:hypothetical protein
MRFISQDGVSEYPTVILLLNRIFFRDKDRGGEHIGITIKVKKGDDIIWQRIPKGEVMAKFMEFFTGGNEQEDSGSNGSPDTGYTPTPPPKSNVSIESLFKESTDAPPIATYFKTTDTYYMNKDDGLFISKLSPFDSTATQLFFPEDDSFIDEVSNILDILSLNDNIDLILTTTRLYSYDKTTSTLLQKFKLPSGIASSMCKLANYFIITSTVGIYIINNIESENDLDFELVTSSSSGVLDNGLNQTNNFTYSLPVGNSNSVEVNGNDNTSCIFNCGTKMGQAGSKIGGTHSRHFNNEPMLFTQEYAYDNKNNAYKVPAGSKYVSYSDYIFFTMTNSSSIMVFLKGSPKKSIEFIFKDTIDTLYMDNFTMSLMNGLGKVYRSTSEGSGESNFYFVFFNYEEFKAKEKRGESTKEIDIRTTASTIFTFLDILKGSKDNSGTSGNNDEPLSDINIGGVDFIFYITGGEDKRVWTIFGDDGRRDDTFKKMSEAFDIG